MSRCLVLKLVLVLAGSDLMVLACDSILSEMKIPSHKVNLLMALLGASFTGWMEHKSPVLYIMEC
jgi:hypothetical protein